MQSRVLAIPGSAFVFGGSLSSLDMHSGLMSVIDPGDEEQLPDRL
jgi:trimethylamine:corrinoid methyltransferase-like protein